MNTISDIYDKLTEFGNDIHNLNDSLAELLDIIATSNLTVMNEKLGDSSIPDMLDSLFFDMIGQVHALDVNYTRAVFRTTQLLNLREPNKILGFSATDVDK